MQDVAGTIYEGAVAFIRRQYTTIAIFALVGRRRDHGVDHRARRGQQVADTRYQRRPTSAGGPGSRSSSAPPARWPPGSSACSSASSPTSARPPAARRSLVEAVQVAMRGGAVSGFLVVSLSLLGVWRIFVLFGGSSTNRRRGAVPDRRLRLRRLVRGPLRPARRRDLHQGRRRRLGPRGQGREGNSRGRSAQRRGNRRPGRRQRRRLRRSWRRPVRVDRRREHRGDDPGRRGLRRSPRRPAGRTPRPGSSSRWSSGPSACWPRSWRSSSCAGARTRTR